MHVVVYKALEALPAAYDALFRAGEDRSFYLGRPWFANLIATTVDPGDTLCLIGVEDDGAANAPLALLVARRRGRQSENSPAGTLAAYTSLYTTAFDLLYAPQLEDLQPVTDALVAALKAETPPFPMLEFKVLERDGRTFAPLLGSLRRHGFAVAPYHQFGNWYADTQGITYQSFAEGLNKRLKQLRRKLNRAGATQFELVTDSAQVERAITIYEQLYLESWKEPETFPGFVPGLARAAAAAGALRFGLLFSEGEPIAAQIWIVAAGRATIFKLVHSERFKRLSPGSILTTRLLEHAIDVDKVAEVDFGRGDDDYKKMWLPQRREFWGILAYNPRTLRGAAGGLRHVLLAGLARRGRELAHRFSSRKPARGEPQAGISP